MKRFNVVLAMTALLLASLACQTVLGGGEAGTQPEPPLDSMEEFPVVPATEESDKDYSDDSMDDTDSDDFSFGGDSDFPMPDDAKTVVSVAGTINYQTSLSLDEVLSFYRDTYGKLGYTEREILTNITDGVFSIVFDGDPSGQAIVIQGVDLGDGTMNVNIRLEDI
jgi:hypothetical protein